MVGKWYKQQNRILEETIYYWTKEKYSSTLSYKPRNLSTCFLKLTNFKTGKGDVHREKSSNVSNMLTHKIMTNRIRYEVRFNVLYTNRQGNTPTGSFWVYLRAPENWQFTIVCGHPLEHRDTLSPHPASNGARKLHGKTNWRELLWQQVSH